MITTHTYYNVMIGRCRHQIIFWHRFDVILVKAIMLRCRLVSKLPQAGLLRIKNSPQADVQLLQLACKVCCLVG